ncbi:MAG TPA: hypothetical protein VJG67_03135 [Candidatus Paceibacterota bacterium]
MSYVRTLVTLVVILLASSTLAFAQGAVACPANTVAPTDAKLDKYPVMSGPLSLAQIADLDLKPQRLKYLFIGYNLHREINPKCGGTWKMEVIQIDEMVLVGKDGYIAYRVSCGNRLVWFDPNYKAPAKPGIVPTPGPNFFGRAWNWLTAPSWPFGTRRVIIVNSNGGTADVTPTGIHTTGHATVQVYQNW